MTRVSTSAEDLGAFAMQANHRSTIGRVNARVMPSSHEPSGVINVSQECRTLSDGCGQSEPVADPWFCPDQLGSSGIAFDLLAEMGDVDAQVLAVFCGFRPPDLAQNVPVRHHAAGVPDK